jgi:phage FluMu gp28-like protein
VICAIEKDEKLRVIFLDEMLGVDFNEQLSTINKIIEILRPIGIAIDKTGMGIPLFDILSRTYPHIEGVTFTAKMRTALINMLANVFSNKKIIIPTHEKLINQLRQFQRTGAPEGEHDDYVMALTLAIHSAVTGPQKGAIKTGWEF